jgi:ketosteroid isomerase-like protein
MSQENVRLHYRFYAAFNRRDLDGALALADDDIEAESVIVGVEGRYHGHERLRLLWNDLFEVWPDLTARAVEVRDLGDVTVADLRLHGRGAGSAVPTDERLWVVARWRRGKCISWSDFATEAEALEAAGLSD